MFEHMKLDEPVACQPRRGNGIKLRKTRFGGLKWVQSFALPQFGAAGRQILNLMPLPRRGEMFIGGRFAENTSPGGAQC